MTLLQFLRDRLRLLKGQRSSRRIPRHSSKPRVGARMVHVENSLRLTAQAGLIDALWQWLPDSDWRGVQHRPDTRHYADLRASFVTRHFDCTPASHGR